MRARNLAAAVGATVLLGVASPAGAQTCGRAVVFALPGVTWAHVAAIEPPHLLDAVASGAAGSVSVRTVASRTTPASGFATIGAGARVDGGRTAGVVLSQRGPVLEAGFRTTGLAEIEELAEEAGYDAEPGALGEALSPGIPTFAVGNSSLTARAQAPLLGGAWTLLATMDRDGVTDRAAVGDDLLARDPTAPFGVRTDPDVFRGAVDAALDRRCGLAVIDHGDLLRADAATGGEEGIAAARRAALLAADDFVGQVLAHLDDDDLLVIVSPTSPSGADSAHLGIAVAVGSGFDAGSSLTSASTGRAGIVTLPDVAPTVLEFFGLERPVSMTGRAWRSNDAAFEIDGAVELDAESVFVDRVKGGISAGFVAFQVLVYAAALVVLRRRRRTLTPATAGGLEFSALAIAAFPVATYAAGAFDLHHAGVAVYVAAHVAITAALALVVRVREGDPLARALALCAFTVALLAGDLVFGGALQLNTVLGYSPIVAGRFSGIGNIAFAVLGTSAVLAGVLLVHRARGSSRSLLAAGVLFAAVVVVDGAPQFGSDVGGVLTLVPAFALTMLLLVGRKPSVRAAAAAMVGAVVALALFLVVDLARPSPDRTHIARTYEYVRSAGWSGFLEILERKARANLRVFGSTIWTLFVPPALAVLAYLLFKPTGRWRRIAATYPRPRAGLIGGLVIGLIGFAVNDSGIVIPAVVLSFLVPFALLLHLALGTAEAEGA